MRTFDIDSPEEVMEFLAFIYDQLKGPYDPASDLRLLMGPHGVPLFSAADGAFLENKMNECFIYCLFNKIDIFQLSEHVFARNSQRWAA